ncbi:hypothetical protein P289_21780, partial [Salmonella enterica subsp. arizonae serovar 18:z4,z23:- str. CVM N9135]
AKGNGQPSKDSGTSGANGGATGADISAYAKQIQVAIQSRLYDASLYQGKQCVLHISLAPDRHPQMECFLMSHPAPD